MRIDNFKSYEKIIVWGVGNDYFQKIYRKYPYDILVDSDKKKWGKNIDNKLVYEPGALKELDVSKALFIVSSNKYYEEIRTDIIKRYSDVDILSIQEFEYINKGQNNSYCLWGIDTIVCDIFERAGYNYSDLHYIEVGANHPFYGSATFSMYLKGASGVLVEPNPEIIHLIKKMRPKDEIINCGISNKPSEMDYYMFNNSYRNTFDPKIAQENIERGLQIIKTIKVPLISISEIVKERSLEWKKNCYLSLPRMGNEKEIIYDNIEKYMFPIIAVGCKTSDSDYKKDNALLTINGYKKVAEVPNHQIYICEDIYNKII